MTYAQLGKKDVLGALIDYLEEFGGVPLKFRIAGEQLKAERVRFFQLRSDHPSLRASDMPDYIAIEEG